MGRFKAGDRVKILAGHPYAAGRDADGDELNGTVKNADGKATGRRGKYVVNVDGVSHDLSFKGRELELLDAPAEWVPAVGDKVVVIDAAGGGKVGDKATITRIEHINDGHGHDVFCDLTGLSDGASGLYSYRLAPAPLPVAEQPAGGSGEVVAAAEAGNNFKAGDRIRCDDNGGAPFHFVEGDIYTVKSVEGKERGSLVWVEETDSAMCAYRFSPAPPTTWSPIAGRFGTTRDGRKVGPMVAPKRGQFNAGWDWTVDDEVSGANEWSKAWRADGTFDLFNKESDLDLVSEWVEPAVASTTEEPEAFTLEADRYGKTRDGRKVGTIRREDGMFGQKWCAADGTHVRYYSDNGSWYGDGTEHENDIVAFWPATAPTPAPVAVATPAPLKVGDRVISSGNGFTKYRVEAIDGESVSVRVVEKHGTTGVLFEDQKLELFSLDPDFTESAPTPTPTPTQSFIVARLTSKGEPRPNARPRVHAKPGGRRSRSAAARRSVGRRVRRLSARVEPHG